jgi:hypothetical protein
MLLLFIWVRILTVGCRIESVRDRIELYAAAHNRRIRSAVIQPILYIRGWAVFCAFFYTYSEFHRRKKVHHGTYEADRSQIYRW